MSLLSILTALANGPTGLHDDEDGLTGGNPVAGYDRDGYLVPRQPVNQAQSPVPQVAPQSPQAAQQSIDVTGDPWKPKKISILGALADAIAHYTNGTTPFQDKLDKENMIAASRGLMGHPDEAVGRVAQVDPDKAWKYRSQVADDTRGDETQQRLGDIAAFKQREVVLGHLASMMKVAADRKDPAIWKMMRDRALTYAHANKIDDAEQLIPEDYNPDALDTIAIGTVPVYKQMQAGETERHHRVGETQQKTHYDDQRQYYQGMVRNGATNAATGQAREQEQEEHNDVTEGQTGQRIKIEQGKQPRMIMTKHGPLEVQGNVGILHLRDGTSMRYLTTDGVNFVPTHQKPNKGK